MTWSPRGRQPCCTLKRSITSIPLSGDDAGYRSIRRAQGTRAGHVTLQLHMLPYTWAPCWVLSKEMPDATGCQLHLPCTQCIAVCRINLRVLTTDGHGRLALQLIPHLHAAACVVYRPLRALQWSQHLQHAGCGIRMYFVPYGSAADDTPTLRYEWRYSREGCRVKCVSERRLMQAVDCNMSCLQRSQLTRCFRSCASQAGARRGLHGHYCRCEMLNSL